MEEKEEIEQSLEQDSSKEEAQQQDGMEGEKVIPMIETSQSQGQVGEDNEKEADQVKVPKPAREEGKLEERKTGSPKKVQQGSTQTFKSKVTIPRPFSLATERRMSRERRGSVDFKDKNPISRLSNVNSKALSQSFNGAERRTSDLRHAPLNTSIRSKISLPPKMGATEPSDQMSGPKYKNRTRGKENEKKKSQAAQVKKEEKEGLESKKIQKITTFKARPLPSFYQQKGDLVSKSETEIPASHPKYPLPGQESKSVPKCKDKKEKTVTKTRTSSSTAKQAIAKLLKPTRNSANTNTPKEKAMKDVASRA
ncbi:hypothetical protein NMG60_11027563 [Bertholletia excelsa]